MNKKMCIFGCWKFRDPLNSRNEVNYLVTVTYLEDNLTAWHTFTNAGSPHLYSSSVAQKEQTVYCHVLGMDTPCCFVFPVVAFGGGGG